MRASRAAVEPKLEPEAPRVALPGTEGSGDRCAARRRNEGKFRREPLRRENDGRDGPGAFLALQPQPTAMELGDRLDERQPEAAPLLAAAERVVDLDEGQQDAIEIGGRNADA